MLEDILRTHLPTVEVWAYGSRVSGHSHGGSDLDLVLRSPEQEQIPIRKLADLEEALRESTISFHRRGNAIGRVCRRAFIAKSYVTTWCWWACSNGGNSVFR